MTSLINIIYQINLLLNTTVLHCLFELHFHKFHLNLLQSQLQFLNLLMLNIFSVKHLVILNNFDVSKLF